MTGTDRARRTGVADPPPESLRAHSLGTVRRLPLSALIGVGVVLLMTLGRPDWLQPRILLVGALIGATTDVCCSTLVHLLGGWTARFEGWARRLLLATLFFVGGCLGWVVAGLVSPRLLGVELLGWGTGLMVPVLLVGGVGVVVGSLLSLFEVLRARLAASFEEIKKQEVTAKELEIAGEIQRRLLPPVETTGEGYRVSARQRPASWVAGDFYDVFESDGTLVLAVADVAGKGVGASLIMASAKAMLPLISAGRSAAETLTELNTRLAAELSPRQFVAMAIIHYDPSGGAFELANAGLPDAYLLRAGTFAGTVESVGPRLPLGARQDVRYEEQRGTLAIGDGLLLLTDGIPEARDGEGAQLGYEGLERLLGSIDARGESFLDQLIDRTRDVTTPDPSDDWTALFLERLSPPRQR